MSEKEKKDYSFIKEIKKDMPKDRKKAVRQVLWTAFLAVLFGLIAALVIAFVLPRLQRDQADTAAAVASAAEEGQTAEDTEEISTESVTETQTDTETGDAEQEKTDGSDASETDASAEDGQENPEEASGNPEDAAGGSETELMADLQLTPRQAQDVQNQLYEIGHSADSAIVTVTGIKNTTDWYDNITESSSRGSGLIISAEGSKLMILTSRSAIAEAEQIQVGFATGQTADAAAVAYDDVTGLAVIEVESQQAGTLIARNQVSAVRFSTEEPRQGDLVIAVGSPLGSAGSVSTGQILETGKQHYAADRVYDTFSASLTRVSEGQTALLNIDGELIGILCPGLSQADESLPEIVDIRDLMSLLSDLRSGKMSSYAGAVIMTVTPEMAETYAMPAGVLVREVEMDSPAMAAGLQPGDVITAMSGVNTMSAEDYEKKLSGLQSGTECSLTVQRQSSEEYITIDMMLTVR